MKRIAASFLFSSLLLLAGCEDEAPAVDTSETGGEVSGEILGGTISDEMIPLEQLTSTSPPAERPRSSETSQETSPSTTETNEQETPSAEPSQEIQTSESAATE